MSDTSKFSVLHIVDTIYTADSVEWCPNEPFENFFVCANYQLQNEAERFGKIRLYSLNDENELKFHQIIDNEAVLDQKWCHNKINGCSYLGVVSAKNTLEIYKLDPELIKLSLVTTISNENNEILMLSLDWSTGKFSSDEPSVITSDSKGNITVFQLQNDLLIRRASWSAHSFEAWICAYYYWNTNLIFSGGDDSRLCQFDLRIGTEPITIKNKTFSAGVTSIHSNKEKENLLATGSYDEQLLLWDIRNMKHQMSDLKMPDSVWRLKWNPNNYNYLLAACMRGGFHIVDCSDEKCPEIAASYYEHKDIAYGCDWKYNTNNKDNENYIIAACSFYDHKLSIATIKLKAIL